MVHSFRRTLLLALLCGFLVAPLLATVAQAADVVVSLRRA
jgi:hypothetical protein